jgi:hypothetical protein
MIRSPHHLRILLLILCFCGLLHPAFAQQPLVSAEELPETPAPQTAINPSTITGIITDGDGDSIAGAKVSLLHPDQPNTPTQQIISNPDGTFTFTNATPGSFRIAIDASGFASEQLSGSVLPGQQDELPPIALRPWTDIGVNVTATQRDIAQAQIQGAEQQRIFGAIPNFYVSYDSNPAPLATSQKFDLAWKTSIDPVTFLFTGVIAGVEQAENTFPEYGQGAQGYAKYYGASYADGFIGTMIGGAILPSILKQDPRYFYKGTGTIRSRALYAAANVFICKGDNGRWQPNYSGLLGGLAAAGISNLYYPAADRGAAITFENTLIDIGGGAAANLFQEFLLRKLTPHLHNKPAPRP